MIQKIDLMVGFNSSSFTFIHLLFASWRRGWDSNPRSSCPDSGFQDRHVRPLRHPSLLSLT